MSKIRKNIHNQDNQVIYCQECNINEGKNIRFVEGPVCNQCENLPKYKFITKTDAKNYYLVKDTDLAELEYYEVQSTYGRGKSAYLYNKYNVIVKACDRYNKSLDELDGFLQLKKQEKEEKSNARRTKILENKNAKEALQRNKLIQALQIAGLELRNDSKLCQMYISGERNDLDYIIRRMCEMRYLYEYCHMNEFCDEAYEIMKEERRLFGHCDRTVHDIAENIALRKYSRGRYPDVFPWQN